MSSLYNQYDENSLVGIKNKRTMHNIIQELHKFNSKQNNWKYYPLEEKCFEYDNLAFSICYVLDKVGDNISNLTTDDIAKYISYGFSPR